MAVDAGIDQPVGGLRRQQQVVDANAVVLLPGAGLIIPERIKVAGIARRADGVGEPEIEQRAELLAGLRQKQRIILPGLGAACVGGGRDDVVITRQDESVLPASAVHVKRQ